MACGAGRRAALAAAHSSTWLGFELVLALGLRLGLGLVSGLGLGSGVDDIDCTKAWRW